MEAAYKECQEKIRQMKSYQEDVTISNDTFFTLYGVLLDMIQIMQLTDRRRAPEPAQEEDPIQSSLEEMRLR